MELSGKIFKVLPLQSGESQRGKWQKQDVVIETENGKFPKKVCVTMWGDLLSNNSFEEGKDISVEFDVESREFNGKWYTDVKAWRVNRIEGGSQNSAGNNNSNNSNYQKPSFNNAPPAPVENVSASQIDDDLPF
ncbi:MAG: hypothetical protein JWN78_2353 [Bacteroidota bacterium]|nr:hypothetical protein [Bacteroidota bacterium]